MPYSVLNFIEDVATDMGVLGFGQHLSSEESDACFRLLNQMLESWSIQRAYVYTTKQEQLALTANKASYTIGTGGDLNTDRPVVIKAARAIKSSLSVPLKVWTDEEWAAKVDKAATGLVPEGVYNDTDFDASGYATIYVLPIPNAAGCSLELWTWKQLAQFATIDDTFSFPPGYALALRRGAAVEFAPTFRVPLTNEALTSANMAIQAVKNLNLPGVDGAALEAAAKAQAVQMTVPQPAPPQGQQG